MHSDNAAERANATDGHASVSVTVRIGGPDVAHSTTWEQMMFFFLRMGGTSTCFGLGWVVKQRKTLHGDYEMAHTMDVLGLYTRCKGKGIACNVSILNERTGKAPQLRYKA